MYIRIVPLPIWFHLPSEVVTVKTVFTLYVPPESPVFVLERERELVLDALFVHAPPTFSQTHRKECFSSDCSILMLFAFWLSKYELSQFAVLFEIKIVDDFVAADKSQTAISEADMFTVSRESIKAKIIITVTIFLSIFSPPSVNKNNMNYDFYDEFLKFFYFYLNFVIFNIFIVDFLS